MVPPQTAVSISISAASVKFEKSIEIVATILLACATVGSAWSAYQAKRWGGVQMFRMIAANGARSESVRLSDKASQLTTIDVSMFLQYAAAVSSHQQQLADFILKRFRPEMKVAVDAWLVTRPLKNPVSPLSPFGMKEYSLSTLRGRSVESPGPAEIERSQSCEHPGGRLRLANGALCFHFVLWRYRDQDAGSQPENCLLSLGIVIFVAT